MGNEKIPQPLSPEVIDQRVIQTEAELSGLYFYTGVLGTRDGPLNLVKDGVQGSQRIFINRDLGREFTNVLKATETLESRLEWYEWQQAPESQVEIREASLALEEVWSYVESGLFTFEEYEDNLSAYNNLIQEPQLPPGFNFPFRLFEEETTLTPESIPQQDKVRLGDKEFIGQTARLLKMGLLATLDGEVIGLTKRQIGKTLYPNFTGTKQEMRNVGHVIRRAKEALAPDYEIHITNMDELDGHTEGIFVLRRKEKVEVEPKVGTPPTAYVDFGEVKTRGNKFMLPSGLEVTDLGSLEVKILRILPILPKGGSEGALSSARIAESVFAEQLAKGEIDLETAKNRVWATIPVLRDRLVRKASYEVGVDTRVIDGVKKNFYYLPQAQEESEKLSAEGEIAVKTRERKIGRPPETVKFPLPLGHIIEIPPRMKDALEVLLVGTEKVPVSADELAEYMFYEELKSGKITLEEARRQVVSNYAWRLNVMFKELKLPYEIVNASKLGEKAAYFVRYPREAEGRAPEAEVKNGSTKASDVQALADQELQKELATVPSVEVNASPRAKPILEIPYEPDPEDIRTEEETRILKGVIVFLAEGHTRLYIDRLQAAMLQNHPEGRTKAFNLIELSELLASALRKIQRQAKIPLLRQRLSQEDLDVADKIVELKARFENEKRRNLSESDFIRLLQGAIRSSGD